MGECLGCQTQFAVDVLVRSDIEGPEMQRRQPFTGCGSAGRSHDVAVHRGVQPGLIELAERDDDAELIDALHDALGVASPAGPP